MVVKIVESITNIRSSRMQLNFLKAVSNDHILFITCLNFSPIAADLKKLAIFFADTPKNKFEWLC